jgi:hypothetical protein
MAVHLERPEPVRNERAAGAPRPAALPRPGAGLRAVRGGWGASLRDRDRDVRPAPGRYRDPARHGPGSSGHSPAHLHAKPHQLGDRGRPPSFPGCAAYPNPASSGTSPHGSRRFTYRRRARTGRAMAPLDDEEKAEIPDELAAAADPCGARKYNSGGDRFSVGAWGGQAAMWYSWVSPSRTGFRSIRYSARLIGSGRRMSAWAGASWPMARWGRVVL